MKEIDVEKECCKIARAAGWAAVKLEKNGNVGIPDRLFVRRGGGCLFVEFKHPNAPRRTTPEQDWWAAFLGNRCVTVSNVQDFTEAICRFAE